MCDQVRVPEPSKPRPEALVTPSVDGEGAPVPPPVQPAGAVTVLDRYGHLLPGTEDRVNDALDRMPWIKLIDVPARASTRVETLSDPASPPHRFYRLVTPRQP